MDTQQSLSKRSVSQPLSPEELVGLFFQPASSFGEFERVSADQIPRHFRELLNHGQHMTVTMEDHYGSAVDVKVLECLETADIYARKIVLYTQSRQQIVLFGIVRLYPPQLDAEVFRLIREQKVPLGRILIGKQVLRSVILENIFRVQLQPMARELLGIGAHHITYGRTARILVAGKPAIDLLEIVLPPEE